MRPRETLVCLFLFAHAACGVDRDAGKRFCAERDLWQANWEARTASIRPQFATEDDRAALARRYESIAERYAPAPEPAAKSATREEIETIAARALLSAAQTYVGQGDSTRMIAILDRLERDFGHLPLVAAEVALAQGGVAEARGQIDRAVRYYRGVVDRVEPRPGDAGAAGAVLALPLRIARIRGGAAGGERVEPAYGDAQGYYESQVREHPGTTLQVEAQILLADVAADQGDWRRATDALRGVESQLRSQVDPPRDPAQIRMLIAGTLSRAGASSDSLRHILESFLDDFPRSKLGPQALTALTDVALGAGDTEGALSYLERIQSDYKKDVDVAAGALLRRAQILEHEESRWSEALEAYRSLTVEYPITEAALQAPLEIVRHYRRLGDENGESAALERAEGSYRGFIDRYPPGPRSVFVRERLAETLTLQKHYGEAIEEMVALGEDLVRTPRGVQFFLAAAQLACVGLADTARAATILDRTAELYADVNVGKWAADEAARLRGSTLP